MVVEGEMLLVQVLEISGKTSLDLS